METGGRWEGLECWAGVGGKGRKVYLNNNKIYILKKYYSVIEAFQAESGHLGRIFEEFHTYDYGSQTPH